MKTGKILNRLQEKIKIRNYEKHKKEVNLLVDTEGLKKHIDVYNEIALAKETIANFAKKNTVSIDIFDTASSAEFAKNTKPELAESMNDCITIRVKDMLTGRAKDAIMPAQTKGSYLYTRSNTRMLHNPEEGTEYIYQGEAAHEDNFIRTVYRYISRLTNDVKGKKS